MDVDLLERCRARDPAAFRTLATIWGPQALKIARAATDDPRRAAEAVRDGLTAAWRALPSEHSEAAFRPWFLSLVLRSALGGNDPVDEMVRAAVRARTPARADAAFARLLARDPRSLLPSMNGLVGMKPDEPALMEARRRCDAEAPVAWATVTEPDVFVAAIGIEDGVLRRSGALTPGTIVEGRARLGSRRPGRTRIRVTRAEAPHVLSWTERPRRPFMPGLPELRWELVMPGARDDGDMRLRLIGVAFPAGYIARAVWRKKWARVEPSLLPSMRRRLERFALAGETSTRRASDDDG